MNRFNGQRTFLFSILPMMSSKHVEQSSAAAIASKKSSRTRPWIDEKRSRSLRATCARTQHKTMKAALIRRSVNDICTREILSKCQKFSFWFSWEIFYAELSAKNKFHFSFRWKFSLKFASNFTLRTFWFLLHSRFIDWSFAMQFQ